MIEEIAQVVQERLKDHIYGRDKHTLAQITQGRLAAAGWKLALVECGLDGELHRYASQIPNLVEPAFAPEDVVDSATLNAAVQNHLAKTGAAVGLGAYYLPGPERQLVSVVVLTPAGQYETVRAYGGPPQNGPAFAVNTAIDFLRRSLPQG
jgi:hypothetical protein